MKNTRTPTVVLPSETAEAAAHRQELIQGWKDSAGVAALLGSAAATSPDQHVAELRKQGGLLRVWVIAEQGYRYPSCQIHDGVVLPVMQALLSILPPENGSGWSRAEWLYGPHALLAKHMPAELLASEPDRVLDAARREYQEDVHAGW